jgi:hypothetical protein
LGHNDSHTKRPTIFAKAKTLSPLCRKPERLTNLNQD